MNDDILISPSFEIEARGGATIVHVFDEVDLSNSDKLASTIARAAADGDHRVIIALDKCAYCDSTALGAILNAKKRLGSRLKIAIGRDHKMRRLFEVTNLTDHFRLTTTIDEALVAP